MNKQKYRQLLLRTLLIGFFGGIFIIMFSYFLYIFNFIEVSPKVYMIRSWTLASWTNKWQGEMLTICFAIFLSIVIALLYFLLFKKILSVWFSIIYGVILWLFVGYMFSFLFSNVPALHTLDTNTIFSSLCLFILYGTFIGYSISFDYYQTFVSDQ